MKIEDLRCRGCGALLAKVEGDALTLLRGGLQATFQGTFRASFVCYRPACKRLNVYRRPDVQPLSEHVPG